MHALLQRNNVFEQRKTDMIAGPLHCVTASVKPQTGKTLTLGVWSGLSMPLSWRRKAGVALTGNPWKLSWGKWLIVSGQVQQPPWWEQHLLLLPAGELLNGVHAFHWSSKEIKATPDTGALPGSQDSPEFFNRKATLSGSFIPFVFADTARMKPMPQKQPGVEQEEEETQKKLPKGKVSHLTISQGTASWNLVFKVLKSLQKIRGLGCSQGFGRHI